MALSILDGNQSATTLSTILSSGQHITAHTVVSLGTQAITDMRGAVSGSVVSVSNLPSTQTIAGTVTANLENVAGTHQGDIPSRAVRIGWGAEDTFKGAGVDNGGQPLPIQIYLGISSDDRVTTANPLPISGTVTANVVARSNDGSGNYFQIPITPYDQDITSASDQYVVPVQISTLNGSVGSSTPLPISGTVTANLGSALPTGTNRIGVVTIGGGTVTIGAGTAQIGSVTASISGTVPVSGTFFQATQPVSLTTLPALVAGAAQIGSVTASISGTVPISISSVTVGNSVTIGSLPALVAGTAQIGSVTASLSISSTAITSGSFTSLTSSTLVPANTARKMATVYNLGAGQLFVNAGATATTLGGGFMVALSSGDFFECNYTTTTLSAIFATAGTASWVSH